MPIFKMLLGLRTDDPEDTAKKFSGSLSAALAAAPGHDTKVARRSCEKYLGRMKKGLLDDGESGTWLLTICKDDLVEKLIYAIIKLEIESKRCASSIIVHLLQNKYSESKIVDMFNGKPKLLTLVIGGYSRNAETAICCGPIIRESMKHSGLLEMVVTRDNIKMLLGCMALDAFDTSSDAYESLKELFARPQAKDVLNNHFDDIIDAVHSLLHTDNYVSRRQSLRLLGDLLSQNPDLLDKYVASGDYLKIHMNLMRDKSKSIKLESFFIFQHFVVARHKSKAVGDILARNRNKLLQFLESFSGGKNAAEAESLAEAKKTVINTILDIAPSHSNSSSLVQPSQPKIALDS